MLLFFGSWVCFLQSMNLTIFHEVFQDSLILLAELFLPIHTIRSDVIHDTWLFHSVLGAFTHSPISYILHWQLISLPWCTLLHNTIFLNMSISMVSSICFVFVITARFSCIDQNGSDKFYILLLLFFCRKYLFVHIISFKHWDILGALFLCCWISICNTPLLLFKLKES